MLCVWLVTYLSITSSYLNCTSEHEASIEMLNSTDRDVRLIDIIGEGLILTLPHVCCEAERSARCFGILTLVSGLDDDDGNDDDDDNRSCDRCRPITRREDDSCCRSVTTPQDILICYKVWKQNQVCCVVHVWHRSVVCCVVCVCAFVCSDSSWAEFFHTSLCSAWRLWQVRFLLPWMLSCEWDSPNETHTHRVELEPDPGLLTSTFPESVNIHKNHHAHIKPSVCLPSLSFSLASLYCVFF